MTPPEIKPDPNNASRRSAGLDLDRNRSQPISELSDRQLALQPYLVTKAKRGVVGRSRYASRLRSQIQAASDTRESVLVFGEPGLEKDNIAALIHFGSAQRRLPMIQINCKLLDASGSRLFGRIDGEPGLIEWLGEGTLVLNNIHETPLELVPKLIRLLDMGTYQPAGAIDQSPPNAAESVQLDLDLGVVPPNRSEFVCPSQVRIILISEKSQAELESLVDRQIKVPPLRVRKADLRQHLEYYIAIISRDRGLKRFQVSEEAIRRLQTYDFPGNLRELRLLVDRAIIQADGAIILTEELFWAGQKKGKELRFNLLNAYPKLRKFLRSDWWPDRINYGFTLAFFAIVVTTLFIGPQQRGANWALNMFWAWWWPLILIGYLFVGRLWCAVCPFMIYGEVAQKLSLWLVPRKLKQWPRKSAERWGGWFLFGLFTLIYLWEELWDLPNTAYLSAWLLLLITGGAVVCSVIFERRFWCRYLCPIGGMNGLFAKLSMTELRAQQGICSADCTTYQCYKGGPQKGEGMETNGCPLYSHPAQMQDNRDCVLCMTCLKACPHKSVQVNLRPPGIELWTTHIPRSYEVALLLLLLGGIYLHRLPEAIVKVYNFVQANEFLTNLYQLDWLNPANYPLAQFGVHFELSAIALTLPLIPLAIAQGYMWLDYRIRKQLNQQLCPETTTPDRFPCIKPRPFVQLAYGYLPLVLGGNLAHYLNMWLEESGRILPITLATLGLDAANFDLPIVVAHPAVIAFLQGVTLIVAVVLSWVLTQKIARQSVRQLLPQHLVILILAIGMWVLIVPT
jgi:transcriptional regulator with AAA-type ATPase domain/NAD-dependent dihydropyrimidine dehydrogenase PreA subunit